MKHNLKYLTNKSIIYKILFKSFFCEFIFYLQVEISLEVHTPILSIQHTTNHGDFQTLVY